MTANPTTTGDSRQPCGSLENRFGGVKLSSCSTTTARAARRSEGNEFAGALPNRKPGSQTKWQIASTARNPAYESSPYPDQQWKPRSVSTGLGTGAEQNSSVPRKASCQMP